MTTYERHEEETLGKAYDPRLVRRLLGFVRPYARLVAVAVGILVMVAAFELALPYLTRSAIDDHIVATSRVVTIPDGASEFAREFIEAHRADLVPVEDTVSEPSWFVASKQLSGYDPREVARATDLGVVGSVSYYLADGGAVRSAGVDASEFPWL